LSRLAGRLGGLADLLDVLDLELGRVGDLLVARLVAELQRQLTLDALDLPGPLAHVDREPDRPARVLEAALDRLADPQRAVGREPEALAPVELLDGADEAEHALLHQVAHRQALTLVLAGDAHHEPEVGIDHPLLRHQVALLDALRELLLLLGREQGPAPRLGEQQLQWLKCRVDDHVGRLEIRLHK
jgi:hypothetical protein